MSKKSRSGMNNPDHIFKSFLKQFFGLKYFNFLMRIRGRKKFGSGIRDATLLFWIVSNILSCNLSNGNHHRNGATINNNNNNNSNSSRSSRIPLFDEAAWSSWKPPSLAERARDCVGSTDTILQDAAIAIHSFTGERGQTPTHGSGNGILYQHFLSRFLSINSSLLRLEFLFGFLTSFFCTT
jgi:hypothetical protein